MSATNIILRASILAALMGTVAARGDTILTLGVTSDGTAPAQSTGTNSSAAGSGGFFLSMATPSATGSSASSQSSQNLAMGDSTNQSSYSAPASYSAPVSTTSTIATPRATYDAFINLGAGPFADAGTLTTGNAQPWYASSQVAGLFGGQPNAQQRSDFDSTVLQRVEQTFRLSGVAVNLTDDPTASAAHTLSVVSNSANPSMPGAIGMTNLGGNGFHFIDNAANSARSVDQLEWIVAHNVAHELMLAFGVPEVNDQTGKYVDSTVGQLSMFLNPNATFSPGAVRDLLARDFQAQGASIIATQAQLIDASPVPEPTTLALWGLGAVAALSARRPRRPRS